MSFLLSYECPHLPQDLSIGWGSYAGPVTYFYEISDGKLKPLEYFNDKTKKKEQIALMRSLKTDWKLVKAKNGKAKDILHIACRPDGKRISKDEIEVMVYYDRFHFDGKEWVRYRKVEKDFWENEGDFPFSKFPSGPKQLVLQDQRAS